MNDQKLKPGYHRVQVNPECIICLDGGKLHGMAFRRATYGDLIVLRKLEKHEIITAQEQSDLGVVVDAAAQRREFYISVHENRGGDDKYKLFYDLDAAIDYSRSKAKSRCSNKQYYKEEDLYLFYAQYSVKKECVFVKDIRGPHG